MKINSIKTKKDAEYFLNYLKENNYQIIIKSDNLQLPVTRILVYGNNVVKYSYNPDNGTEERTLQSIDIDYIFENRKYINDELKNFKKEGVEF